MCYYTKRKIQCRKENQMQLKETGSQLSNLNDRTNKHSEQVVKNREVHTETFDKNNMIVV